MNMSANVVEISAENFQAEVVEKSKTTPVFLEFYADEAEPSRELAPVLRRLADEYHGKFLLARVDIRENQQLVQQLQVRTLPTIKVIFQGQMVQNLEGPQQEGQLRALLDQLTMSPIELVRSQLDELLTQGNRGAAISLLQQAVAEEPKNYALHAELCDLLIMDGRAEEAKQILAGLPDDTDGINKPKSRLEFLATAADLPSLGELTQRHASDPGDVRTLYELAVQLVVDDQMETALDRLLEMLQRDRSYGDELARKTMIKVFDLLGKGSELATAYRRKMFTLLH